MPVIVPPAASPVTPWDRYQAALNAYGEKNIAPEMVAPTELPAPSGGGMSPVGTGATIALMLAAKKSGASLANYIAGGGSSAIAPTAVETAAVTPTMAMPATPLMAPGGALGGAGAGTTTATPGALTGGAEGVGSLGTFAGAATPYLGAGAVGLGALGAGYGIHKKNPLLAALGGGTAGLGVNMMGYGLGPWGWGAMIAAPAALALAGKLTNWGDKDMWKTEGDRLRKLQGAGVNIDPNLLASMPTGGRSKEELIRKDFAPDFIGKDKLGAWINNKFASSRSESDLRPEDIQGYAFLPEKFGNSYASADLGKKLAVSKMLLDANAVNEHHGTMDYKNLSTDLETKIRDFLGGKVVSPSTVTPVARVAATPARSRTVSPGIGKDGKRISYGKR